MIIIIMIIITIMIIIVVMIIIVIIIMIIVIIIIRKEGKFKQVMTVMYTMIRKNLDPSFRKIQILIRAFQLLFLTLRIQKEFVNTL